MSWKSGTRARCSQASSPVIPSPDSDMASSWWMSTGQQRRSSSTDSTRPAHALEERGHGVWCLCLQDSVEVADIDAQLQRGGAYDAGVAAVVEALLRELALFPGHGAVMDEHVDAGVPHVLGDGLRRGPGLAEEQALAAPPPRRPRAGGARRGRGGG